MSVREAIGRAVPFARWSFIRMALGARRLEKEWQVGDGREAALQRYVLGSARRGDIDDAIRAIDARTPLPAETCHWACVELMDVTAQLVGAMLPEVAGVSHFADLQPRLAKPGATIVRPK